MKTFKNMAAFLLLLAIACGGGARKNPESRTSSQPDSINQAQAYDYFVRGDLYEQSGNLNEAAEMYRKALIYDPSSVEIRRILSNVYLRLGRFNEAAVLRSEIAEKTAEDYNFIGNCLQYTRDYSGAADFYRRSLDLDPTQFMPRRFLAALLEALGNYDEAEKNYKKAVQYSPDKKESLLELGSFYLKAKKYDDAIAAFEEARNEEETDIRVIAELAAAMMARGDTAGADSLLLRTMEANWDQSAILQSLAPLFYSVGDLESAEKTAGRIAELNPGDPEPMRNFAFVVFGNQKYARAESLFMEIDKKGQADSDVYYYLGRIKQFNEQYDSAEEYFKKALALEDSLSDAWINLALSVDSQGRYQEALSVMKNALEKIPADSTGILFYTSLIHSRNNKYELARDGYKRLLESNPDNLQFKFNLAASFERLGDFDMAEKYFKEILKDDPDNALSLNYLGYMYADRGVKLEESEKMIQRALEIEPDNGAFLDSYAWVLYKLGKYEKAIDAMNSALENEQEDPILYDHQGDIYAALNQFDKANDSWKKALELDPDNETIRAKIKSR
jgi:tetratricopeptide (TPR) repeat protein